MGVGVRREGRDAREWMYVMWGDEIRGRTTSLLHVEGEDVLQPAEMEKSASDAGQKADEEARTRDADDESRERPEKRRTFDH